jgi:WS/DGAT/MGAT family acyltransferase
VQFLALEDDRTHGHVGTIATYDPSTAPDGTLTLSRLKARLRERIHLLAPLRWKLVRVPMNLDHPFWAEDPDFDLDYHIREIALPEPGDLRQLAEQSARIFERRLDRARPLWEMYLVRGIEDGTRVGLLTKVHHALLDGLSGAEILTVLLDLEPGGREIPLPDPAERLEPIPGRLGMLAKGITGAPRHSVHVLRNMPGTLPNLDLVPTIRSVPGVSTIAGAARRVSSMRPGHEMEREVPRLVAPRSEFSRPISAHRRIAFQTVSLPEVKRIKNHLGVTLNDVVVAVTAAALRGSLLRRGSLPDEPLLAMVPISVRLPEEFGTFGNRVSMMVAPVPTTEADPRRRVERAHEWLGEAKRRHSLTPRMLIEEANEAIPPAIMNRTAKLLLKLASSGQVHPPLNVVISNVPGSPVPLYLAGALLEAQYPLSVIADGMGLNFTILSYRDRIDFGIVGDRELVPDIWQIADDVKSAHEELVALVEGERPKAAAGPKAAGESERRPAAQEPQPGKRAAR